MKKASTLTTCFLLLSSLWSIANKKTYDDLKSLHKITNLVYGKIDNSKWIGKDSLVYQSRNKKGLDYFLFTLSSKKSEKISKDSFNQLKTLQGKYKENTPHKTLISPDKKWTAYIEDNNVKIKNNKTKLVKQLSYDGAPNHYYTNQLFWSSDSRHLVSMKHRNTNTRQIPLIESKPNHQLQPIIHWRNYAKPGDELPIVLPSLFNIESFTEIPLNMTQYEHQYALRFTGWEPNSQSFTFEFNERGHQRYQVVRVNTLSGITKNIIDEKSNTFIHYHRLFRHHLHKNNEIIWSSERDGWRHLYVFDAQTGVLKRQLTKGEWVVKRVLDINEELNQILFVGVGYSASRGEDPYNEHLFRIDFEGKHIIKLTKEEANHTIIFSPDKTHYLDIYARPDLPGGAKVCRTTDGKEIADLGRVNIDELLNTGWTLPEVYHTKGRDETTDIWGTIYRPSNYDPNSSYPVVEYIYAGPHDSHVTKNFSANMRFQKLLEMGFIVVTIDGMGTANRSKAFHDYCWRDLKDAGFPDRIKWIKSAANKYPEMNIKQVGIYGYSAGGQNTMSGLLFHGDFYKVGVSLCGCHDNRMDKIWWNEQWMGYPLGPWYSASSNVDNAHRLSGKLLLINGELDDNVDPTSTLQVVGALVKANKEFDQLYLPGYGHGLGDDYITKRVFNYFVEHCKTK